MILYTKYTIKSSYLEIETIKWVTLVLVIFRYLVEIFIELLKIQ